MRNTILSRGITALVFSTSTFLVPPARVSAAPAQTVDGSVRLGLETSLFEFARSSVEGEHWPLEEGTATSVQFGPYPFGSGVPTEIASSPPLGIDVGLRLNDSFIAGSRLGLNYDSDYLYVGPTTTFSLYPYVDYIYPLGKSLHFFAGVLGGIRGYTGKRGDDYRFGGGAETGLMIFVAERFCIGPRLSFLYLSGRKTYRYSQTPYRTTDILVDLLLGVSGWI